MFKFVLALALICAFAFTTVQSLECTEADNADSYALCTAVGTVCDTGMATCDDIGVLVSTCKDAVVTAFTASVEALPAAVTDCECAEMTCEAGSGSAFVAMSFMAVFAGLLL